MAGLNIENLRKRAQDVSDRFGRDRNPKTTSEPSSSQIPELPDKAVQQIKGVLEEIDEGSPIGGELDMLLYDSISELAAAKMTNILELQSRARASTHPKLLRLRDLSARAPRHPDFLPYPRSVSLSALVLNVSHQPREVLPPQTKQIHVTDGLHYLRVRIAREGVINREGEKIDPDAILASWFGRKVVLQANYQISETEARTTYILKLIENDRIPISKAEQAAIEVSATLRAYPIPVLGR